MNAKHKVVVAVAALAAGALALFAVFFRDQSGSISEGEPSGASETVEAVAPADSARGSARRAPSASERAGESPARDAAAVADTEEGEGEEEPKSEEELREEAEAREVDAFDALTDKWMEPVEGGVTMKDVDNFSAQFRKVPKDRREECLHRALNLVPDENVMLLAGILMDKSQDRELVELVYNDVLNRDEDVKKPILQQIFKDKSHPCWADTAWILDVTDELPGQKPR